MKEPKRVFDLLLYQLLNYPNSESVNTKIGDKWQHISSNQFVNISSKLALGFLEMGLKKGDRVGLVSESRAEWNFVDFACQQIGVVLVPMYPNIGEKDYEYIFREADMKLVFFSSKDIFDKMNLALEACPETRACSFNKIKGVNHWMSIMKPVDKRKISELN